MKLLCMRYYLVFALLLRDPLFLHKTIGIQPLDDDEFPMVYFPSVRRRGRNPRLGISHIFNANR